MYVYGKEGVKNVSGDTVVPPSIAAPNPNPPAPTPAPTPTPTPTPIPPPPPPPMPYPVPYPISYPIFGDYGYNNPVIVQQPTVKTDNYSQKILIAAAVFLIGYMIYSIGKKSNQ